MLADEMVLSDPLARMNEQGRSKDKTRRSGLDESAEYGATFLYM